jgi:hypothetical protein
MLSHLTVGRPTCQGAGFPRDHGLTTTPCRSWFRRLDLTRVGTLQLKESLKEQR